MSDILEKYLERHHRIDFLSIDVEGLDLQVLKSNDWLKFRPKVVLVEILNTSIHSIHSDPIYEFLIDKSYHFFSKAVNTSFFVSNEFLPEIIKF